MSGEIISIADFKDSARELGEEVEHKALVEKDILRVNSIVEKHLMSCMDEIREAGLDPHEMAHAVLVDGVVGLKHFGWELSEVCDFINDVFNDDDITDEDR
jgi:hypothetical protein